MPALPDQSTHLSKPADRMSSVRRDSISVIIPVYNESGTLERMHAELSAVLGSLTDRWEVIFVDDGSSDGSTEILDELARRDEHVRVLAFRSNQGKAEALSIGFAEASCDIVVTMDADLQDRPSELPRMLAALDGFDLVSGWKKIRHDPIGKTVPSRFFNWVVATASGIPLHDFNCGFKVYRSEVVKEVDLYGEMHRFIPVIAARRGFRVTELPIEHSPRTSGRSKYGVSRLFKGAYDLLTIILLTRFEYRPLHFFGSFGVILGSIGFAILMYMSYLRLVLGDTIGRRPLLFLGIVLLLSGIQFFSTGLIGELLVRRTRAGRQHPPMRTRPVTVRARSPQPPRP